MGKHKLLVEGKHDGILVCTLCHRHNINAQKFDADKLLQADEIACKGVGSIEKLRDQLDVELDDSELEVIGIIVDADDNLAGRWQSLCARLKECGYLSLPTSPQNEGTIVDEPNLPRLGIWVMPNNQITGMMEDFAAFLIPDGDGLWPYAQQCVEDIEGERPFGIHIAKAKIHTWLAWCESPGTPLGSAIQRRYLDANVPQALIFIRWIQQLFQL